MGKAHKTYLNWSSGKDAAMALYILQKDKSYSVDLLVTTVNKDLNRVSMHGLREELLNKQAQAIGLPLTKIDLQGEVSMEAYNRTMHDATSIFVKQGFTHSAFGDIFLEDLREYREQQLEKIGMKTIFPLWKKDSLSLMQRFLDLGFKAITICVNDKVLDKSFVGREVNSSFLKDLPASVDPCGENGEFHTFVYDGPIFTKPVPFQLGEKVKRVYSSTENDGDDCFKESNESWDTSFWYCDVLP